MSFNFDAAIAAAKKDQENRCLNLLLLGSSGNGKSYTQGTFGVKTLYLYTTKEDHGPASASSLENVKQFGDNVKPVRLDIDETGKQLSADETYKRLLTILNDLAGIKKAGFGAVAIDSATEIEELIKSTTEYNSLLQAKYKGVESYAGPIVLSMFRPIISALKTLRLELNVHSCMTCILDVQEYGDNGAIVASKPSLAGYNVATGLCQMFADVMVVGKMKRPDGTPGYPFQVGAQVSKSTQDFKTKEVRKTHNFNIRLTGCDMSTFPDAMPSNLSLLIKCKQAGKFVGDGV